MGKGSKYGKLHRVDAPKQDIDTLQSVCVGLALSTGEKRGSWCGVPAPRFRTENEKNLVKKMRAKLEARNM